MPSPRPPPEPRLTDCAATVTALLNQNTPVTFRAGGPSMTPALRDGESVQVRPLRAEDLRPGALLLYTAHGRLVLHRLVRVDRKKGTARMTGDAALSGTEEIPLTALIGVAQRVLRDGKMIRLDSLCARRLGRARFLFRPLRRRVSTLLRRSRKDAVGSET